jgi:hypothetical protein
MWGLSISSWPLQMGPIGCPDTTVRNYHYLLRNNPEVRSSQSEGFSFWFYRQHCQVLGIEVFI